MKRSLAWHVSRRYGTLFIAVLTLGLPISGLAAQEQDMTQIHITMSGSPGAEFSATGALPITAKLSNILKPAALYPQNSPLKATP